MVTPTDPTTHSLLVVGQAAAARDLLGLDGSNRCTTRRNQLGAENDLAAIAHWLQRYPATGRTRGVYTSELRRLYWWLVHRRRKPMSSLTASDLTSYRHFLASPGDTATGHRAPFLLQNGTPNPAWRPCTGPLTPAHQDQVFVILNSLFGFLVRNGYLDGNPLAALPLRQKGSLGAPRSGRRRLDPTERALDTVEWRTVLEVVDALPDDNDKARLHRHRARFIMRLFYYLGGRISEFTMHSMGSFRRLKGSWWWCITGKGGKDRNVPVNSAMLAALQEYRLSLGLTELPRPGETTPIVARATGGAAPDGSIVIEPLSSRQLYRLIRQVFELAADRLEPTDRPRAHRLRTASPHSLRHTTATHFAAGIKTMDELVALQKFMGHQDINTTMGYTTVNQAKLQEMAEKLGNLYE